MQTVNISNFAAYGFFPLNFTVVLQKQLQTIYKKKRGTLLVVQWLRLQVPNAGGPGSIPGRELDLTCHN